MKNRAAKLVAKALSEVRQRQQNLNLDFNPKAAPTSDPAPTPETSIYFDFGTRGVLPRRRGSFRYSYGRLVNPTTWHGDNVVCNNCGHEFDPSQVPETSMGAVGCPRCRTTAVIDRGRTGS